MAAAAETKETTLDEIHNALLTVVTAQLAELAKKLPFAKYEAVKDQLGKSGFIVGFCDDTITVTLPKTSELWQPIINTLIALSIPTGKLNSTTTADEHPALSAAKAFKLLRFSLFYTYGETHTTRTLRKAFKAHAIALSAHDLIPDDTAEIADHPILNALNEELTRLRGLDTTGEIKAAGLKEQLFAAGFRWDAEEEASIVSASKSAIHYLISAVTLIDAHTAAKIPSKTVKTGSPVALAKTIRSKRSGYGYTETCCARNLIQAIVNMGTESTTSPKVRREYATTMVHANHANHIADDLAQGLPVSM